MRGRSARYALLALGLPLGGLALAGTAPAAYPGVNGDVVFTSTQDGGARHIFVKTAGGITDLTGATSSAADTQPKVSPDGHQIVFTRGATGLPNAELFVMSVQGTQRVQLTNTPQGNSDPTWSPDGTQIAFISERNAEVTQIFIMRTDGTDVRQITHDNSWKSELAWSPRGDRIAFVHEPAGGGDRDIYSIRTNGTGLTDLTNDSHSDDIEPAWSPDGSRLAYSGPPHPKGSVGGDLWTMNADGSGQQPLQHETNDYSDGAFPAWSPDGTMIAFSANNGSGYYHLWVVPAGGGENSELVANRISGSNPGDEEADWQPQPSSASVASRITRAAVNKRRRTAQFAFIARDATSYRCELRRGKQKASFKRCRSSVSYKHLKSGSYTFEVMPAGPGERYKLTTRRFKI